MKAKAMVCQTAPEISKITATISFLTDIKLIKVVLSWGSAPNPTGEAHVVLTDVTDPIVR